MSREITIFLYLSPYPLTIFSGKHLGPFHFSCTESQLVIIIFKISSRYHYTSMIAFGPSVDQTKILPFFWDEMGDLQLDYIRSYVDDLLHYFENSSKGTHVDCDTPHNYLLHRSTRPSTLHQSPRLNSCPPVIQVVCITQILPFFCFTSEYSRKEKEKNNWFPSLEFKFRSKYHSPSVPPPSATINPL